MWTTPTLPLLFLILAGSSLVSVAVIFFLERRAAGYGLMDEADGVLKSHRESTPVVGGLGVAAGLSVPVALLAATSAQPGLTLARISPPVVCALAMCCMGVADDRKGLSPASRLFLQLAGASVFCVWAAQPWAGWLEPAGWLLVLPAALFVGATINFYNMQDGMDGLAGLLASISCIGLVVVSVGQSDAPLMVVSLALLAASCAFLAFNFPPARVFLGDSGTYMVGFLLSACVLRALGASPSPPRLLGGLLVLGVIVGDGVMTLTRRVASGRSPLLGDRGHVYDLLLLRGLSTRRTLFLTAGLHALVSLAGAALLLSSSPARP